jgi:hypothetical protein
MFPTYKSRSVKSGSILFTSDLNPFSLTVSGYEILFRSIKTEIPTHCEIYFRDIGIISAQFPVVKVVEPRNNYLYIAVNGKLVGDELLYWRNKLLERLGSPYDLPSLLKFLPDEFTKILTNPLAVKLKEFLGKVPAVGYNCVTLFRGLVPFNVDGLTVREFMLKLAEHGWKVYRFPPNLINNLKWKQSPKTEEYEGGKNEEKT